MAKRKNTDTSSKTETTDAVEAEDIANAAETGDFDPDKVGSDDKSAEAEAASDDIVEASAEPVEGETADLENADVSLEAQDDPDAHISEEDAKQLIEDAELHEPATPAEDTNIELEEPAADAQPIVASPPEVIREKVVERKGGFFPMLIGGAVAAALGYGGAAYVSQDLWPFAGPVEENPFEAEVRSALEGQDASLSEVAERIAALEGAEPPSVDLSPIETGLASVQDTLDGLTARLDDVDSRVEALERAPMEQAVSPEAIAAYESALADLQAEVEAQRAEVAQMAQEAVQAEENAVEQAQLAAARAALAEVTTALDTGASYADAVATLAENGVTVPDVLSANAAEGVATQAALAEAFPDVARAALSDARSVATDTAEGGNRVATFFANQLGARSVAPREGDDPDAVLSRAEAAVREGDLSAALSEISALPDAAQSAVADWQARASTRLEAKSAADGLVQQLVQE